MCARARDLVKQKRNYEKTLKIYINHIECYHILQLYHFCRKLIFLYDHCKINFFCVLALCYLQIILLTIKQLFGRLMKFTNNVNMFVCQCAFVKTGKRKNKTRWYIKPIICVDKSLSPFRHTIPTDISSYAPYGMYVSSVMLYSLFRRMSRLLYMKNLYLHNNNLF